MRAQLAAADANNAESARDLSISHEKIGNLIARKGESLPERARRVPRVAQGSIQNCSRPTPTTRRRGSTARAAMRRSARCCGSPATCAGALASANQARKKLREGVAAKDPNNLDARADLLHNDEELATIHGLLAKKDGDRESAQAACHDWERVLQLGQELERHGALDAASAADVQEARAGAGRCWPP